jgi:hypothetical protein
MRPSSSEAMHTGLVGGRSRKSSTAGQQQHTAASNSSSEDHGHPLMHSSASMTYFLADEATVAASTASGSASSTFGVRSLSGSAEDSDLRYRKRPSLTDYARRSHDDAGVDNQEVDEDDDEEEREDDEDDRALDDRSIASFQSSIHPDSRPPAGLLSQPLTPILGPQSEPPGSPGSISYRSEEDVRSEMISASPVRRPSFTSIKAFSQDSSDAPQLIMPEITIPSRRPFTERGKRTGKLKVLIAGDSGRALFPPFLL